MQVANIILNQLGGNKYLVMTGAKNICSHGNEDALSFRLPSHFAKQNINHVKIKLNGNDLYDMEFGSIHGRNFKVLEALENVYFDQLQTIFTDVTGLDTRL